MATVLKGGLSETFFLVAFVDMAGMCAFMYVCFIIVHLPSFGCETSCQILNHSGVQECILCACHPKYTW